ncbi:2-succinyl-6-hydroxy-2,4-cyclohexadiene-1-carboxy late synthase [Lentibacillus halophilus]|uniref:Putative 2-succinyl-6-hydroxy-2,4-cyclohexadiene-1-carboxylate synthase n=1 Tax=Lentibacillus halophilus TaxID=295065 RepID=A0ABN0Z290_9BACI
MYVRVNDAAYWCHIRGNGEPVLLLHGFTGTSRTWDAVITDWLPDYQTIAVDLPGHGKTTAHPTSMEACCHDLANILDHLQWTTVHVIGYSMGGRTALSFAMLHPERVRSLTLESASPGLDDANERHNRRCRDDALASWITTRGIRAFADYWASLPMFDTQKSLPQTVQQSIREERLEQSATGLAQSLVTMGTGMQPSWWHRLTSLHVPVQLLAGENDAKFCTILRAMDDDMSQSHFFVVSHAGHAIHVEQTDKFGKIVRAFLQSMNVTDQ